MQPPRQPPHDNNQRKPLYSNRP